MKYFAKFNTEGNRVTSIAEGVHFSTAAELKKYTDDGFIEISEADQELYASNKYIRDAESGKPITRPPDMPTTEDKAKAISTQYAKEIAELKDALATAMLAGDVELIEELKSEYAEIMKEYQTELEAISNNETM